MRSLTVLYDEQCALCRRCRTWLEQQPTFVPVFFLAAGSTEARTRYSQLPWLGADLVVVSDDGDAWVGAAAFLLCLWATERYRSWSYRLSGHTLAPLAERFFHAVSKQRGRFNLGTGRSVDTPECPAGRCRHRDGGPGKDPHAIYSPPQVPWQPPSAAATAPRR